MHRVSSKLRSENNWKEAGCRLRAGGLLTFSTPLRLVRRHSESGRDSFHNHQYLTTTTFFRDFSLQRCLAGSSTLSDTREPGVFIRGGQFLRDLCNSPPCPRTCEVTHSKIGFSICHTAATIDKYLHKSQKVKIPRNPKKGSTDLF